MRAAAALVPPAPGAGFPLHLRVILDSVLHVPADLREMMFKGVASTGAATVTSSRVLLTFSAASGKPKPGAVCRREFATVQHISNQMLLIAVLPQDTKENCTNVWTPNRTTAINALALSL